MDLRIGRHNKLFYLERQELTPREKQYLSLVALGYKNQNIAKILIVSYSTVKKALESIFRKLNAKDRTNAVTLAFLQNILTRETLEKIEKEYNLNSINL